MLNKSFSAGFVISFQDVRDCGESRRQGRKERQAAEIKKKKPILTYLTAKISSDRFSSDLMLKQMDRSDANQIRLPA